MEQRIGLRLLRLRQQLLPMGKLQRRLKAVVTCGPQGRVNGREINVQLCAALTRANEQSTGRKHSAVYSAA